MQSTSMIVTSDGILPSEQPTVRLSVFEGPLDLLLFLIKKNEIDIYDIPIESILDQYLQTLSSLQTLNLELSGDFFVMAATLMLIKSRMLLPPSDATNAEDEDDQPELDPRWELVEQLIEYKKAKELAENLQHLIDERHNLLERIIYQAPSMVPATPQSIDHLKLWSAFNAVLSRLAEKLTTGEIEEERITVESRMYFLLQSLQTKDRFTFSSLFPTKTTIPLLVATFLALLELSRLKKLQLEQTENFSDILCTRGEGSLQLPTS